MGAPSFKGSVTYASVPLEIVDRSRFDFVSVDLYRDVRIRDRFTRPAPGLLRPRPLGRHHRVRLLQLIRGDSKSRPR